MIKVRNNQNNFRKIFEINWEQRNNKWERDFIKLCKNLENFATSIINRIKVIEDNTNNLSFKILDINLKIKRIEDNCESINNLKLEFKELKQLLRNEIQIDITNLKELNTKLIKDKESITEK